MNATRTRRVASALEGGSATPVSSAPNSGGLPSLLHVQQQQQQQRLDTTHQHNKSHQKGVHSAIVLLSQFRRAVASKGHGIEGKDHGDDHHNLNALEMGNASLTRKREARPLLADVADEGDAIGIKYGGRDQRDASGKARTFQVRVPKKLLLWTMFIFLGPPLVIFFVFEVHHRSAKPPHTDVPHSIRDDKTPSQKTAPSSTSKSDNSTALDVVSEHTEESSESEMNAPFPLEDTGSSHEKRGKENGLEKLAAELDYIERDEHIGTSPSVTNSTATKDPLDALEISSSAGLDEVKTSLNESETSSIDILSIEKEDASYPEENNGSDVDNSDSAILKRIEQKKAETKGKLSRLSLADAMREKNKKIKERAQLGMKKDSEATTKDDE